jgi:hypothetical protein
MQSWRASQRAEETLRPHPKKQPQIKFNSTLPYLFNPHTPFNHLRHLYRRKHKCILRRLALTYHTYRQCNQIASKVLEVIISALSSHLSSSKHPNLLYSHLAKRVWFECMDISEHAAPPKQGF